jgi:DTW domain-containing protein
MPRSVVRAGAARCPYCSLPPRWCVCAAIQPVRCDMPVHVLIHRQEQAKPSSTGKLIARVVEGATCHVYQRRTRFLTPFSLSPHALAADRELWILHPQGETLSSCAAGLATGLATELRDQPRRPQVLLLDGTWRQAGEMLRAVEGMGRCVRLPEPGPSRYWLREYEAPAHVSTAEALLELFRLVGDAAAESCLRLHFELHVYASLMARGRREMAERYLGESPLWTEIPDVLDRLMTGPAGPLVTPSAGL